MGISARTRVLMVGFAMALVAACSGGYDSTTAPGGNNGGGNNTGGNNGPAVNISGFAFAPAADTVTAGTTVTWTNLDSVAHDMAQADLPAIRFCRMADAESSSPATDWQVLPRPPHRFPTALPDPIWALSSPPTRTHSRRTTPIASMATSRPTIAPVRFACDDWNCQKPSNHRSR